MTEDPESYVRELKQKEEKTEDYLTKINKLEWKESTGERERYRERERGENNENRAGGDLDDMRRGGVQTQRVIVWRRRVPGAAINILDQGTT